MALYLQFIYTFACNFGIISSKTKLIINKEEVFMNNFIAYEKLSKKEKRKLDNAKRGNWGGMSPVTRRSDNPKAYNRKRAQDWKKELPGLRP